MTRIAIAHDYLTQRGGAERVVLAMLHAFSGAPVYTSLYDPAGTFPEFADADVHVSPLDRLPLLRHSHRFALPVLAQTFSHMHVDADVVVCSTSGWAHGIRTPGRKIVYCHNPARWLYQPGHYMGGNLTLALALGVLRPWLLRWDRSAAAEADRYVVNSTVVRERVARIYGVEAEVLHPPVGIDAEGRQSPLPGIEDGFLLVVGRLLPYKNVAAVAAAMDDLPHERLVVVGEGPQLHELRRHAPPNVRFVDAVGDDELRWLYAHCVAAVTAAYEDFGLVPLEAASFGRPTAALRFGGFLDTIDDGRTGILFDEPKPRDVARAIRRLLELDWNAVELRGHAAKFSSAAFAERLRALVEQP